MKMVFRWFGEKHDSIPIQYVSQIPNVSGVAATLMDKQAGELWTADEVAALKNSITAAGLEMEVIESVNIHDDIKLGVPSREKYIENYKETIKNLGQAGVRVICYNFMPIFDWMRTDLWKKLDDGSETMSYDHTVMESIGEPNEMIRRFEAGSGGFSLPGWEPERLSMVKELFRKYDGITHDDLMDHLRYFLEQIMPVCEEYNVKMAIHPDDPPWDLFGLPRVLKDRDSMQEILTMVDNPYNGITLCTGSLGVSPDNDIPALIREFGERIPFAHVRNFKRTADKTFWETSHFTPDGSLDMYAIVKALHDCAPDCYIRPDHGRMIWGEKGRPGYGLYDRALGVAYINGLWESMDRQG